MIDSNLEAVREEFHRLGAKDSDYDRLVILDNGRPIKQTRPVDAEKAAEEVAKFEKSLNERRDKEAKAKAQSELKAATDSALAAQSKLDALSAGK